MRRTKGQLKQARKRARKRDLLQSVPEDLVFEQTGGICDYCNFPVSRRKGWVRIADGASYLPGLLLWTEVRLAHSWCAEFERGLRKTDLRLTSTSVTKRCQEHGSAV